MGETIMSFAGFHIDIASLLPLFSHGDFNSELLSCKCNTEKISRIKIGTESKTQRNCFSTLCAIERMNEKKTHKSFQSSFAHKS